jgi:acyl-CoA thioesterase
MSDQNAELASVLQLVTQDPFARSLGIELLELGPGFSRTALTIGETMLNFQGLPHGGVIFSLADAAFAAACNSRGDAAVALNVNLSFVAAVPLGTRLVAEATEESLGRRTGLYRLAVSASDGTLVALGQGTAYRRNRPLIQE